MANSKTYRLDPNVFSPASLTGVAQHPADRDAAAWDTILASVNQVGPQSYESLDTAATLSNDVFESLLTVSGTMAFTLADGTYQGQRKRVVCVSAASTPKATLTVTTPETASGFVCASAFVFDTVGQAVEFVWASTGKWRVVKTTRAGVKITTVGTTVLTGYNLCHNLSCSVTGTVVSGSTMGVPNGQYPGDRLIVSCSTAASTPIGSIAFTGLTLANVAATDLQAIGATTDMVDLSWNGSAWLVTANSGITVA